MNRRPSQSRTSYDSFSPQRAHFAAATPGNDFFDSRRKKPLGTRLTLYFFLLILFVFLANFISNRFIHIRRVSVPVKGLGEAYDGYTLLHISDLKGASFGSRQQLLAFALGDSDYDAVVLTGDMISSLGSTQPFYALIEQLRVLRPDVPVYFIAGDDDPAVTSEAYFTGGSPFAPWVLGAQQRGAQLLSAPVRLSDGDQALWLAPASVLNLDLNTMQRQFEQQYLRAMSGGDENAIELSAYQLTWLEETRAASAGIRDHDALIALSHAPMTQEELGAAFSGLLGPVDLTLSGHYLGGLLRLPVLGAVFIPSGRLDRYGVFPGPDAYFGLSREGSTNIYVSPGLGSAGQDYPPFFFRFFNPPSVTLVTLTPSAL